VFLRDGYIDRYSGNRLVFPGVLRLISHLLPTDFPYHPNWTFGVGHPWYWDLFPTVDHLVPVAGQGVDDATNWVTTSMRGNLLKSNRTLSDLGWTLAPSGDAESWDGRMGWYVDFISNHPELQGIPSLRAWQRAAIAARVP
jgi:hypothetical protein